MGTILCAVNPFKMLPLYTPTVIDGYKQKGARGNPPHVYALADNAYNRMPVQKNSKFPLLEHFV